MPESPGRPGAFVGTMQTPIQIAHSTSTEARPRGEAVADGATMPSVSTIVVTYNNERQIADCLAALQADPAAARHIIVLDNASADATVAIVERSFPDVQLIRSPENLGFGRACNQAAAHGTGDYVAFVNPDTVLRGAAITELLRFAESRPGGGIYGGRAVTPDGRPRMESCFAPPSVWGNLCFGTGLSTAFPRSRLDPESLGRWNRDSVREVGVVTGMLMLVRRDLWEQLEGFDEDFFMYAEDVDISLRAAQLGYRPCITPAAVVVHEGGGSAPSTGTGRVMLLTGRVTLIRKQWSPLRRTAGISLLTLGVGLRAAAGRDGWRQAWRERAQWTQGYPRRAR
jgi:N-acetylglucosaminyl-diphospho-decaprenol L-rhamnosyltransferase